MHSVRETCVGVVKAGIVVVMSLSELFISQYLFSLENLIGFSDHV